MRLEIGLLLPLLLAGACSDDGLASQSSGQIDTSTTGSMLDAGSSNEPGSAGASTSAAGDGTTATPPGGTTTGTGGTGTDTATIGPESLTDTGSATGTSGTETDATTTGGPSQACIDGCAIEFMCGTEWASAEDCVTWCENNLMAANDFSPFCRDAWEALSACLATLTCEEFAVWQDPMEFPYPCSDADTVLSVECKGQ